MQVVLGLGEVEQGGCGIRDAHGTDRTQRESAGHRPARGRPFHDSGDSHERPGEVVGCLKQIAERLTVGEQGTAAKSQEGFDEDSGGVVGVAGEVDVEALKNHEPTASESAHRRDDVRRTRRDALWSAIAAQRGDDDVGPGDGPPHGIRIAGVSRHDVDVRQRRARSPVAAAATSPVHRRIATTCQRMTHSLRTPDATKNAAVSIVG
ncbi:MAG TPA: hypothetical protein VFY91_00405, partial [Microbacterium sp.]|nr:hypothetical protein [Microbacterium sp.]